LGSIPTPEMDMEIDEEIQRRTTQSRAIASDVDGTILTSKMTIHPRTRLAITKAIKMASSSSDGDEDDNSKEKIQHFFPATGKSRKGALDSLGIEIGSLIEEHCGGVYLQGLFCVDPSGTVVYEQKLDREAIDATESLVEDSGISIVGYDGDDLYTTDQTEIVIHLHEHYGEPLPVLLPTNQDEEELPSTRKLRTHEPSMHKLLLLDDDTDKLANVVRPKLEALAEKYNASVTQALPTMLELLPQGCSKALGVTKLCEALGINPGEELLALGDAENDAGMLDMACIGVAVGNASPPARDSSDLVIDYTNDDGGAGYAIEWFGLS
jgi:hydroxymethylpyrimidine pyrophosphatase-like HAD family hydrolase